MRTHTHAQLHTATTSRTRNPVGVTPALALPEQTRLPAGNRQLLAVLLATRRRGVRQQVDDHRVAVVVSGGRLNIRACIGGRLHTQLLPRHTIETIEVVRLANTITHNQAWVSMTTPPPTNNQPSSTSITAGHVPPRSRS